jgi:hypothetical protein
VREAFKQEGWQFGSSLEARWTGAQAASVFKPLLSVVDAPSYMEHRELLMLVVKLGAENKTKRFNIRWPLSPFYEALRIATSQMTGQIYLNRPDPFRAI